MTILSVIYQLKNLLKTIKKVSFSPKILFFAPFLDCFFYCQLACSKVFSLVLGLKLVTTPLKIEILNKWKKNTPGIRLKNAKKNNSNPQTGRIKILSKIWGKVCKLKMLLKKEKTPNLPIRTEYEQF